MNRQWEYTERCPVDNPWPGDELFNLKGESAIITSVDEHGKRVSWNVYGADDELMREFDSSLVEWRESNKHLVFRQIGRRKFIERKTL